MSLFTKLGLTTDDNEPLVPASIPQPPPTPQMAAAPQMVGQTYQPLPPSYQPAAPSDPNIVAQLKSQVLGTSPIISQFMQNVDLARSQFPNDENACMKAALAFTRVDKNALLGELNRTVAAALLHTKSTLDADHKKARDSAVGGLESQLSSVNSEMANAQRQIAQLQQLISTKQTSAAQLQGQIRDAETNLQQQDAVVRGSLAQVEQFIATLGQTFSRL